MRIRQYRSLLQSIPIESATECEIHNRGERETDASFQKIRQDIWQSPLH
jgi:hypothetical protein